MLVFVVLVIFGLALSYVADIKNSVFFMLASAFIIGCVSAFRGTSVGIDTPVYYDIFSNLNLTWKYTTVEKGFIFVGKQIMNLTHNALFVFAFYSFVTIFLVMLRLWTLKKGKSFSFMVLVFLCLYFPLSMNIMRQFFALSIVFFSTIFLERKKPLLFVLPVVFSALFHYSALFGLLLLVVYYYFCSESKRQKRFLVLFFLISIPIAIVLSYFLFDSLSFV